MTKTFTRLVSLTAAIMLAFSLAGCANGSSDSDSEKSGQTVSASDESTASAKDVLSQIDNNLLDASAYFGEDTFSDNCEKLFGVTADKLSDGGIIYASGGGNADEVCILKMADGSSAKQILEERLELRRNTFENYKPEEITKIDSAEIFEEGGFWVLVLSDSSSEISKKIKDIL